ncbi:MAG: phosphoribosylaminoimidazolesuccinocarboxamide synthase, partial [Phycisphaerales bacterium]
MPAEATESNSPRIAGRDVAPPTLSTLTSTRLELAGRRTGKVRDLYELPADPDGQPRVLIVAPDRVSAFDV